MSESEIVLPLDETIWDYVDNMEGSIGIHISETKVLDLLGALYDIYEVNKTNQSEGQELIIGLTALLVAAPLDQADKVWEELSVRESMKNFELQVKDVLDGAE
jgi:hypothetical protein